MGKVENMIDISDKSQSRACDGGGRPIVIRWEFRLFYYREGRGKIGLNIADWLNGLQANGNVLQVTMFESGNTDGVMVFAQVAGYPVP